MKDTHGGDILSYYEEFGNEPLDFSANISPLGLPPAIKEAIISSLDNVEHYPDPHCRKLRKKLGEKYALPMDYFLCGNGAADLIYRFVVAVKPKESLVLIPTFSEYADCLTSGLLYSTGITYHCLSEERNFMIGEDFLDELSPDLDICFLCQPNNPTGQVCSKEILLKILTKTQEFGIKLFIDECFIDFLEEEEEYSLISYVKKYPHLVILKAFTKIYAMPGLRLGYMITSDTSLLENLNEIAQPWSVSSLAQIAGLTALEQDDYIDSVKKLVTKERDFLESSLIRLGFKVFHSQANFILFQGKEDNLKDICARSGILIRDCHKSFHLKKGFYRIAVRNRWENEKLIDVLEKR